jgi:hypothetical protein
MMLAEAPADPAAMVECPRLPANPERAGTHRAFERVLDDVIVRAGERKLVALRDLEPAGGERSNR